MWEALKLYGVHPHVINLLDLHTGTEAVVRVDGEVGRSFTVKVEVQQGCVIAPTLFNVFVNHILKEALAQLPPTSNLVSKLLLSRAVDCRQISSLTLWHLAKTEIMVVGRPMTLPTFKLSGKELLVTDGCKYLRSFFADDGSISREMDLRCVCALAAFQYVWASPKLSNNGKCMCIARLFCPFCCTANVDMYGGSDAQARGHSFLLSLPHCWREADGPPQA
eukprot:350792-Chlamydomonas_euryale.AAC.2